MIILVLVVAGIRSACYQGEGPLLLTPALATTVGGIEQMSDSRTLDSGAVKAARIAILALRASIPPGVPVRPGSVLVADSSAAHVLSDEKAAEALAAIPKPVTCRAEAPREDLIIRCEGLSGDMVRSHGVYAVAMMSGLQQLHEYPKDKEGLLLIRGRDEVVVVTVEAFERWCRDYSLPLGVAVTGRGPRKGEESGGVGYEFVISRPEPVDP